MQFTSHGTANRTRYAADINLTSLVDIIFNLLLFFILTASVAEHPGIDLSLPKAESANVDLSTQDLSIVLAEDGTIFVKDKALDLERLKEMIGTFSQKKDSRVVLQADQSVPYGKVVGIIDLVRSYGIGNISIATDSGES